MFYSDSHQAQLRFGDVLECFPSAHAVVESPSEARGHEGEFDIQLARSLSVILTPCCEVGKSDHLTLAPLYPISRWPYPLRNEYFSEDLLRCNVRTDPDLCLPKKEWAALEEDKKQSRLAKGPVFAFGYLFVYPNRPPIMQDVEFTFDIGDGKKNHVSRWSFIDFRDAYRVKITKEKHKEFSHEKKLELTVESRNILRDKLAQFYGQVPDEDRAPVSATPAPTAAGATE